MELFHGTSANNAKKILKNGFAQELKNNWKVKSKNGFVYLSIAYAPFYAMSANKKGHKLAIIKVDVEPDNLFPDDDFVMLCLGKRKYTQKELDEIELENYQELSDKSLKYMGNVATYPEDVTIKGVTYFDGRYLLYRCDPVISPLNFKIMGDYYKDLSEWLYQGNAVLDFRKFM